MYVVVPVAALLMARTVPLPVAVKTAILVLAISAGAPLLPRKLMKLGREGYVFSLVVTSSLLAVVAVPAWLEILGTLFGREAELDPGAVALVIAKSFLAPLVWDAVAMAALERRGASSQWLLGAAGATLTAAGLALLVLHGGALVAVGVVPLLALVATTLVALAIGHALGGPTPTIARRSPSPAPRATSASPCSRRRRCPAPGRGPGPRLRPRLGRRLDPLPPLAESPASRVRS